MIHLRWSSRVPESLGLLRDEPRHDRLDGPHPFGQAQRESDGAHAEETEYADLPPARLVDATVERKIPSIAYTYSEPLIFYEYVKGSAILARERGLRNVLVTAGYANERPLRQLCRVVDAAKGFD